MGSILQSPRNVTIVLVALLIALDNKLKATGRLHRSGGPIMILPALVRQALQVPVLLLPCITSPTSLALDNQRDDISDVPAYKNTIS
jgi:hypothetical protein